MATIPDLLSIVEAAERLCVSRRTVQYLLARCDLGAVRLPDVRRTLVRAESVADLIERSTERPITLRPAVRRKARTSRSAADAD